MNYFFSKKQESVVQMGKSSSQTQHHSNAQGKVSKTLRSCLSNEDLNQTNRHQPRQMPMSLKGHNNRKKQHDCHPKTYQQTMIDQALACYLESQTSYLPDENWVNRNKRLQPSFRLVAISYMSKLHKDYELEFRTLLLCFNIFDRFMSKSCQCVSSMKQLWEVVYASVDIAMKIQEIYPPTLDEIMENVPDLDSYGICQTEIKISQALDYRFDKVSPMSFFGALCCTSNMNEEETFLVQYLMELHCHSRYIFGRYAFSLIAVTLDYMLHLWRQRDENYRGTWQNRIPKHSMESIKSLARELFDMGRRTKMEFVFLYNAYRESNRRNVAIRSYFETRL